MKKFSLAYFGSPDFAADFLKKLITDVSINRLIDIKFVITQPDQLVGRKQILTPTPVKIIANKNKLMIFNENTRFERLGIPPKGEGSHWSEKRGIELNNIDLAIVYAYGDLIPKEFLTFPKYGFWNIHPSLLPKYRGPSPIAAPLINGDKTTGVTIIKMDDSIDHGPIIAQESLTIDKDDKRPDLEKKLTDLAYKMFKEIMGERTKFFATPTGDKKFRSKPFIAQNHKLATYTKKLSKQDGFIEISKLKNQISKNSQEFFNLFRGLTPWPGLWTLLRQGFEGQASKRLKITDLSLVDGKLIIKKVQMEGKNEVDFETFNKAYKIF